MRDNRPLCWPRKLARFVSHTSHRRTALAHRLWLAPFATPTIGRIELCNTPCGYPACFVRRNTSHSSGSFMNHEQYRIIDFLTWTTLIAMILGSFKLATFVSSLNGSELSALLAYCLIASVPFAFIDSLIRQPMRSSRMRTSFLLAVLISGWMGILIAEFLIQIIGNFQGRGSTSAAVMGMIVAIFSSATVPRFIASLRRKPASFWD